MAAVTGQSTYVPVEPTRVLDTATLLGGHPGRFGTGEAFDLRLAALPTTATAVVLNVTADRPDTATVVRVYPPPADGVGVPVVSNLNVPGGRTLADLVVSKVVVTGGAVQVRLRNDGGAVRLVADLAGDYVAGGAGAGYTGRTPVRLLDTRTTHHPLAPNETRALAVGSSAAGSPSGVPAGATAVVVSVTAVQPTTYTVLRVYPDGSPLPTVSNLNAAPRTVVANLVVVALGSNGSIRIHNSRGSTDVVVDLAGWYVPGSGDVFHPLDPYRALDTRAAAAPVQAGEERQVVLAGAGAVPWHASSVALTVTAVQPTAPTYLTAHPVDGRARPVASNLNTAVGVDVPVAVVVRAGQGGRIAVFSYAGSVHLVVDVAGWFGPAGDGVDIGWPQCRSDGTSSQPPGAAFAIIGLTDGHPFSTNPCLAAQFTWADALPGGGSGYVVLDAPGQGDPNGQWGAIRTPRPCDGTTSVGCAYDYGWNALQFVLQGLPAQRAGGRIQVWLDVEGPYVRPVWQGSTAVNAAVVQGAVDRLRAAQVRKGVYSRQSDWTALTGGLVLPGLQQWLFPAASSADAARRCVPEQAFSPGHVVLSQFQRTSALDEDHAC